jgi:hypothetical protein
VTGSPSVPAAEADPTPQPPAPTALPPPPTAAGWATSRGKLFLHALVRHDGLLTEVYPEELTEDCPIHPAYLYRCTT